jgi:hypothetical protein
MRYKVSIRHWGALAVLALLLIVGPISQSAAQAITREDDQASVDPRFGIIEAFWKPEEAAELSVGWDRILFYWNEIQPTGPEDWNTLHVLEEWLDDAREQDRMVMGLLKNTPQWATDGEPFSGVPRGLYLPIDDPDNLWAGYIRKVVEYYAPLGVHNWIVWNEPEISPGVYGHEFSGTTQDYYQLLKVAYQAAKEHDPQAVIHLAGWSYWHDPTWLGDFLSIATADPEGPDNNYFFDAITLHIYFRVETVEELVEETEAIQERYGLRKPIWINETNASPNLDPDWPVVRPDFQVDLEQQAWYIVQAHALGFGAGAARVGVYKLLDVLLPEGGESFGILRPDGSRRPAFDAYRTTIQYLQDFIYPVGRQQDEEFYAFTFKRPESFTRVLWARNATDLILRVPALADEAQVISATGEARTISAYRGYYRIRLQGARCTPACDIGGPPIFLVENAVGELRVDEVPTIDPEMSILATATPTPLATATTGPDTEEPVTVEPTLEPSETPTASPTATLTPTAPPTATATAPAIVAQVSSPTPQATAVELSDSDGSTFSEVPVSSPGVPVASWLFIGAGLALAGVLAFYLARQRHS